MAAGGVPGLDPPVRTELVCESERTRVSRLFFAGGTVIRKEPLGLDAARRLQHEVAMLERLSGGVGVAQLVEAPRYPGSIVVADAGDASLAGLVKPLAVDHLVDLGLELTRAVAGMHRRGVMHRDIAPANITISASGAPCLVDFALASSFAEIRPEFTPHSEIAGTLAYLAPEQTGRTGRPVDQRADLYALGATLYELATGGPPFGSGDPLRLTHDHLARVPVPPAEVNPAVPGPLSEIIMHLLEKEPDNRYQSADGVIYDLERLRDPRAGPAARRVGEHDVPLRLMPPSRLVGRDDEVAALRAAFEDALAGRCRGVLVAGAPGVGKTALVDELRPVVTGRDGWFVAGKFDQSRRDLEFDAVHQAFRALGRLLLAEPENELAEVRARILETVGANAGLLTAVVPEFGVLLAVPPDAGDPLTAQVRTQRVGVAVLRAVASWHRPVVFFVDDLQWAGGTPLGFVDLVLSEEPVDGLLLVGACRDGGVDAAHPLATPLSRWRNQAGVQHLRLGNLPVPSLVTMCAEMLHVDRADAEGLVEVIGPHTSGNPHETVELLNSLRRDGVLTATAGGWRWENAAVRARLGESEVAGLLSARIHAMPPPSRQLVEAMACLGGRAEVGLLQAATGDPAGVVEQRLAAALDDGLLVVETGRHEAVRFRHDRIREAILRALNPTRRDTLQLAMARRLAAETELFAVTAEQYLPVLDAVDDAAERRMVVGLLRRAADQAALIGDYALVDALLAGALRLIDPDETAMLVAVHTVRHAALYSVARLDEADEEYRTIEQLGPSALRRADPAAVQVRSLTHRNRFAEAVGLGIELLRELGIAVPAPDRLPTELDHRLDELYAWLDHTDAAEDLSRPDITDPALLAASGLIDAMLPPAYLGQDFSIHGWLSLEALRILIQHGPARALVGPASYASFHAVVRRGDYSAEHRGKRRLLALGEARGYEPGTSEVRYLFALTSWCFEPLENGVQEAQRAREGLIAGGDLATAGHTYLPAVTGLLDCAPSLDACVAEVEAGLAFARRTGSEQTGQLIDGYRWLAGVLRGETPAPAAEVAPDLYVGTQVALFHAHLTRAIAAAILGDSVGLLGHTAATMSLLPAALGLYPTALARVLRALALAGQARARPGDGEGLLSELDEVNGWLAERAADAPANFLHLLRLIEAERAWAAGDFRAALLAFDAARREVAQRQRPWHRALIAERAAGFYLAHGVEHSGYHLLAEARQEYLEWGATAKVDQLDWAYPTLRPDADRTAGDDGVHPGDLRHRRSIITTGTIDLLGILSASQALSSETSIEGLRSRVVGVLSAMTGATDVHLLLWSNERQDWLLTSRGGDAGATPTSGTGHEPDVPMSVLRYVQRMPEPLVVNDALRDDRFARDPYFTDVTSCSLLAVPVQSRDLLSALLLLENRLIRGAFTTERLDAVKLIAGQLAVCLDNAQLYAEFRRVADEQAALRRVATLVAQGASPQDLFEAVAEEVGRLLPAGRATIARFESDDTVTTVASWGTTAGFFPPGQQWPLEGTNPAWVVFQTGRPARVDDFSAAVDPLGVTAREAGIKSVVASPVIVKGDLWGAMTAGSTEGPMPPDTEARLASFTELVATAIANAEGKSELAASRRRIVAASDEARRRIEHNLHDGTQQRLVSLGLAVRLAEANLPPERDDLRDQLSGVATGLVAAVEELQEISRGIHPAILSRGGLGPALQALAHRSVIPVNLDITTDVRVAEPIEVAAYYVASEALANAAKHSQASRIDVSLAQRDQTLLLSVRDDGVGGADTASGSGLVGLTDRVEALGGSIRVRSRPGAGTQITAELPLELDSPGPVG
jgi:signal transduction histidine kinase